jgi:hypothetical protein
VLEQEEAIGGEEALKLRVFRELLRGHELARWSRGRFEELSIVASAVSLVASVSIGSGPVSILELRRPYLALRRKSFMLKCLR